MKIPYIDDLLNKITMYRLSLYYLIFLVGAAVVLGFFNLISYSPIDILIEAGVVITFCYIGNFILAKMFKATTNIESVFITALILLLIIPVKFPQNVAFFIMASGFAMGIKYFPTIDKRHIFNPAAGAVAAISLVSFDHAAIWWIGTPAMLPFVLIGGLLVVRRVKREAMVFVFLTVYLLIIGFFSVLHSGSMNNVMLAWQRSIFSSALIFFSFMMLTEPLTSPPTKKLQRYYSGIVAVLYATPQMRLFSFVLTPELALAVGNVFSYIVSPKYRLVLKLKEKIIAAHNTVVFNFGRPDKFSFIPGQYLEWTLSHKQTDSRGNRRYFSISSSPGEELQIAVRFHDKPSSYKKALIGMQLGEEIIAASLSGDFVLPKNLNAPMVFMAGGIGVAPFRSIIKFVMDNNLKVDIILLYSNRSIDEIAFADLFQKAVPSGIRTLYILTDSAKVPPNWIGAVGHFTPEMIKKYIPDFSKRLFYASGPAPMVQATEKTLSALGVSKNKIITDYFPGYTDQ